MRVRLLGASMVAAMVGSPAIADACSPPPPSASIFEPQAGSTAPRPRNYGALIEFNGGGDLSIDFTGPKPLPANVVVPLPRGDGPAAFGQVRWLQLLEPGMAGQKYSVRAETKGPMGPIADTVEWTTSGEIDGTPPKFDGLFALTLEHKPMAGGGDCLPGPGYYARLEWPPPGEFPSIVYLHEADPTGKIEVPRAAVFSYSSATGLNTATIFLGPDKGRPVCFVARAVDLANNQAAPNRMCCATTGGKPEGDCRAIGTMPTDAGTESGPTRPESDIRSEPPDQTGDGGQRGDGGPGLADRGGCSCEIGSPAAHMPFLAAIGVALVVRRRRR